MIAEIAEIIRKSDNFAVAVHVNPDGDCLGSASALLLAIRSMGKRAHIVLDGNVPERFKFLIGDDFIGSCDESYDVCIAVDVAAMYMMGGVKKSVFDRTEVTCCLDHHGTNSGYADYNYIAASASAAGEVVYEIISAHLGCGLSDEIAARIYAAIASDTGSFKYSNTTPRTHAIAAELLKFNIDAPKIMRNIFERVTLAQLRLKGELVSGLRFYMNNRVCVGVLDGAMLERNGLTFDQTDDLASLPRSLEGVEVGVLMKEKSSGEVKVSLRSNDYVDVAKIAESLGGGGHVRAAGVTLKTSLPEAERIVIKELEKVM